MDLWDRLLWLSIGCFIGFVLGYIVRSLHDIKEKVEHVEETVTDDHNRSKWDRGDNGFMRHPFAADVAIVLVLVICVWASFSTANVNADLQRTLACIRGYNVNQGEALRYRDSAIRRGNQSEIDLWTKYEELFEIAQKKPKRIPALQKKLNKAIIKHRNNLEELQDKREEFPYANPDVLQNCEGETG